MPRLTQRTPPPMPTPRSSWRVASVDRTVAVTGRVTTWPVIRRTDAAAKPARKRRGA